MIERAKTLLKVSAPLLASLAIAATHASAFESEPAYVRVRSISYAGSGCPAGSVSQNVASDLKAFTLIFDQYIAEAGPGIPFSFKRKNCQINVDLDFPSGWTYSVITVDYRGYVSLEPGVNALQQSQYYFQGQAQTGLLKTRMQGPVDRSYQIRDSLPLASQVWAPCGAQRSLNINTEVRADNSFNPQAHGVITTDSIDGALKHVYHTYGVQWRRCF